MENQFGSRSTWSRHWLVIYTRPRWEKKVDKLLKLQDIRSYCPVRSVTSQWADRKKIVDLPLFSGYVFVWVNEREEYKVRQTLGVLNFIYYMGKPAVIRDNVIEKIEELMSKNVECEVVDSQEIHLGDRIRIKQGIFYNQEGTVIKVQGKHVLMLLDHLNCAVVSSIPITDVMLNTAI
ncbi:UpxY family transcription antiterminator [Pedobacter gandavensis]|uniref:UpxY family transcription antiterminator n=1 Tax=Pedobacter gandavensis TaxID=2679963 RepID=A0ABR6EUF8_9SPHI|nr:UpxY family transcription antiterminator [Pedobacter gandavensis]MBB2148454.1 UpxY family transcription antiterminator [Pedobacter gandavensis]